MLAAANHIHLLQMSDKRMLLWDFTLDGVGDALTNYQTACYLAMSEWQIQTCSSWWAFASMCVLNCGKLGRHLQEGSLTS